MVVRSLTRRTVYVYLESERQRSRWAKEAEAAGASLSEFVADLVEERLRQAEDPEFQPRESLAKEIQTLRESNNALLAERKMREALVEKLEAEVRRYRAEFFSEGTRSGVRRYDEDLVAALRAQGTVKHEELLRLLRVKPSDPVAVKAVSDQLEGLQRFGLVKSTPRGWRWAE